MQAHGFKSFKLRKEAWDVEPGEIVKSAKMGSRLDIEHSVLQDFRHHSKDA